MELTRTSSHDEGDVHFNEPYKMFITKADFFFVLPFTGAAGGGGPTPALCAHLPPHKGQAFCGHTLPGREQRQNILITPTTGTYLELATMARATSCKTEKKTFFNYFQVLMAYYISGTS